MFTNLSLRNHDLAQRLGKFVLVGQGFLFFEHHPEHEEWMSWVRKTFHRPPTGPWVVPLVGPRLIEVPGGTIHPVHLPHLRLDSVTSDRSLYRAGQDTVHLLVLSLNRPGAEVALRILANGVASAPLPVQLDTHGIAHVPLRDLPAGNYVVSGPGGLDEVGSECSFTVAEYRLAPLIASLVHQRWDEGEGRLSVQMRLETFGVPVEGDVNLELLDKGQRVARIPARAVGGLVAADLPLRGAGPHTVNVQLEADAARTASVPLVGSKSTERSHTFFSTLGPYVTGSLLPGECSRCVRGMYLSEKHPTRSPFRLERVDTARARLVATQTAGPVCVVCVDLRNQTHAQEVVREEIQAGEVLELDVPGPTSALLIGGFVDGVPWGSTTAI